MVAWLPYPQPCQGSGVKTPMIFSRRIDGTPITNT